MSPIPLAGSACLWCAEHATAGEGDTTNQPSGPLLGSFWGYGPGAGPGSHVGVAIYLHVSFFDREDIVETTRGPSRLQGRMGLVPVRRRDDSAAKVFDLLFMVGYSPVNPGSANKAGQLLSADFYQTWQELAQEL